MIWLLRVDSSRHYPSRYNGNIGLPVLLSSKLHFRQTRVRTIVLQSQSLVALFVEKHWHTVQAEDGFFVIHVKFLVRLFNF